MLIATFGKDHGLRMHLFVSIYTLVFARDPKSQSREPESKVHLIPRYTKILFPLGLKFVVRSITTFPVAQ